MLALLTGAIGVGKTTLCQHLAAGARARGVAVGGVLAPPVTSQDRKVGISLVDLHSGETRLLAPLIPLLAQPRCAPTVVIVRDSLLEALRSRLALTVPHVVRVTLSSRDGAPAALEALLLADDGSGEGGTTHGGPADQSKAHGRATHRDVQC
jgi:hypothetical protein